MVRPASIPAEPKLIPPLDGRHLPALLSVGWAIGVRNEHLGSGHLPTMVRTWLEAALDAHAGEILPLIVGAVRLDDDLMHFSVRLRRLVRRGGELVEGEVEVPFAYDRRTGQWGDGGLSVGTGVMEFLLWHAQAVLGRPCGDFLEARHALQSRLIMRLGAAALGDQFAASGTPRPPRASRSVGSGSESIGAVASTAGADRVRRRRG